MTPVLLPSLGLRRLAEAEVLDHRPLLDLVETAVLLDPPLLAVRALLELPETS